MFVPLERVYVIRWLECSLSINANKNVSSASHLTLTLAPNVTCIDLGSRPITKRETAHEEWVKLEELIK